MISERVIFLKNELSGMSLAGLNNVAKLAGTSRKTLERFRSDNKDGICLRSVIAVESVLVSQKQSENERGTAQ
jgi:hypothetical protein